MLNRLRDLIKTSQVLRLYNSLFINAWWGRVKSLRGIVPATAPKNFVVVVKIHTF